MRSTTISLGVLPAFCVTVAVASCGRNQEGTSPSGGDSEAHGSAYRGLDALPSVSRCITPGELDCFRPGATIEEITEGLNGRGNFLFSYRDGDGAEHAVIDFGVSPEAPSPFAEIEKVCWAVFVDRKFTKLVPWLKGEREDYRTEDYVATRYKDPSIKAGLRHARRVVESPALPVDEARRRVEPVDYPVDWGLTIAVLPFVPVIRARLKRDTKANAPLRAKFDGRRVRLGERQEAVEERFGEPIRSWEESGFRVSTYGSAVRFDLLPQVHHSRILVSYRDGLACVVFSNDFIPMAVPGPEHQ